MALKSGSRLGVFEIGGILGAGAMGEVYRARDSKLGRVIIKVPPEEFAAGPERLFRVGKSKHQTQPARDWRR